MNKQYKQLRKGDLFVRGGRYFMKSDIPKASVNLENGKIRVFSGDNAVSRVMFNKTITKDLLEGTFGDLKLVKRTVDRLVPGTSFYITSPEKAIFMKVENSEDMSPLAINLLNGELGSMSGVFNATAYLSDSEIARGL